MLTTKYFLSERIPSVGSLPVRLSRNKNKRPMRAYALLVWFFGHFQSRACMYGEDRIVNGGSFVFTSCIIAIFTISWAIIQSCMGGSG